MRGLLLTGHIRKGTGKQRKANKRPHEINLEGKIWKLLREHVLSGVLTTNINLTSGTIFLHQPILFSVTLTLYRSFLFYHLNKLKRQVSTHKRNSPRMCMSVRVFLSVRQSSKRTLIRLRQNICKVVV